MAELSVADRTDIQVRLQKFLFLFVFCFVLVFLGGREGVQLCALCVQLHVCVVVCNLLI